MIIEAMDNAIIVNINDKFARIAIDDADALIHKAPAIEMNKENFGSKGPVDESSVWETLKTCYDPEIPINIVDLGLIYGCNIVSLEGQGNRIDVTMTLTSPACEMGQFILDDVYSKLRSVPNVTEVGIKLVFNPPWDSSMMSEAAKLEAGIFW
jgi:probable FeS assembly SUF system protein SufT